MFFFSKEKELILSNTFWYMTIKQTDLYYSLCKCITLVYRIPLILTVVVDRDSKWKHFVSWLRYSTIIGQFLQLKLHLSSLLFIFFRDANCCCRGRFNGRSTVCGVVYRLWFALEVTVTKNIFLVSKIQL